MKLLAQVGVSGIAGAFAGGMMSGGKMSVQAAPLVYNKAVEASTARPYNNNTEALERLATYVYDNSEGKEPSSAGETLEDSAIRFENDEASYPYDQREVIDGYEDAIDESIIAYVKSVRNMKDQNAKNKRRYILGNISNRFKNDVKRVTGIDFDGYKHVFGGSAVVHIDNRHGKNGEQDHSMSIDEDIGRIGWVIDNYDTMEAVVDKNGDFCFDTEFRNYDGSYSPIIKMSKRINGTYYVVEAVPNSSSKAAYIKSAYISNKDSGKSSDGMLYMAHDTLQPTPETPNRYGKSTPIGSSTHWNSSATNSIPDSSEKVNIENGIVEEVAKTVKQKTFASRAGMAAQSVLNKIKAGEKPSDSEINELVYVAINDRELIEKAINDGLSQDRSSQEFAVASRLEKKLAKNRSVSAKEFKELILSEFSSVQNNSTDDVSFSVGKTTDNRPVAIIDKDILAGVPKYDWKETVKNQLKQVKSVGVGSSKININRTSRKEYLYSEYSNMLKSKDKSKYADKLRAAGNIEDVIYASTDYINEEPNHERKDNFESFARGSVLLQIGNNQYNADVVVGITYGGNAVLYDIVNIDDIAFDIEKASIPSATNNNGASQIEGDARNNSIHQNDTVVNSNYTQKSENDTKYTEEKRIKFESTARNVSSLKDGYGSYTKEQVRSFRRVADAFGIDVFVGNDNELGADGYYVRSHNGERAKIYLNAGGTNPLNAVIRHEVIHHIKATSINAFNAFSNYVTERYIELYGEEAFEETLSEISETYRTKTGKELTRAESIDEFCADVGMDMFRSPSEAKRLAFADRNVLQRFLDAIREVLRKIEGVFTNEWDYSFKRLSALESIATAAEDGTVYHSHNTASESFMPLDVDSLKEAERVLAEVLKENGGTAFSLNSKNDIENSEEKNYNNNISFLAGKRKAFRPKYNWHTGLTHDQVSKVEEWVKKAGAPDSNRIVGNAYWYTGRLNGSDLFVIYSNEDTEPTVMYLSRGQKAITELNILMDLLEDEKNGSSAYGKSGFTQRVSQGNWLRNVNGGKHNIQRMGTVANNRNAGVLQGQSQRNGSGAFRNVIKDLFGNRGNINDEQSNKEINLSVTNVSVASTSESTDESLIPIEEFQRNEEYIPVTSKNRDIYRHNVNKMFRKAQSLFSVPYGEARKHIKPIIEEMAAKLMNHNGHISDEDYFNLTVELIGRAQYIDREYYDMYKDLKNTLRNTRIAVDYSLQKNIPGWNNFRKSTMGVLTIANDGAPLDSVYAELSDNYPDFFPKDKHGEDQLYQLLEVAKNIKIVNKGYAEYHGDNAEQMARSMMEEYKAFIKNEIVPEFEAVKRLDAEKKLKKGDLSTIINVITALWLVGSWLLDI